jgi:protein-arginine kinase
MFNWLRKIFSPRKKEIPHLVTKYFTLSDEFLDLPIDSEDIDEEEDLIFRKMETVWSQLNAEEHLLIKKITNDMEPNETFEEYRNRIEGNINE